MNGFEASDFDGASIPELHALFEHEEPTVRADAACALGDRLRTREIRDLPEAVQNALAKLLGDPVPLVQLEAAIALAEAHDRRATAVLMKALAHRSLRLDALRALGTLGDPSAISPLRAVLERWLMPWADRMQAAAALCALREVEGARYLEQKLTSRRRAERAAAIHFVGEAHHPRALELLSQILKDHGDPMRDVAARALGLLGHPSGETVLRTARRSADDELQEDIDEALENLHRRTAPR